MVERREYSTTFGADCKGRNRTGLPILLPHETAEGKKIRRRQTGILLEESSSGKFLLAGLDYQDHAGTEDGDIAVGALEGRDRGFIGRGD